MKNRLFQPVLLTGLFLFCAGFAFQGMADLRLHYAFDGDLRDRGPSNNVGTASGGVALTSAATNVMVGTGALLLDGAGTSFVSLTNAIAFPTGSAWSTAFWARRSVAGDKGMAMGSRTNNNDFIWLNDSYQGLRFRSSNGTTLDFAAPKDQNTHHYALIAFGNGTMSLYIDGVLSTNKATANTSFLIDTVGKAYTTAGYEFKGVLDDVRIYDSVLDAGAVSNLYRLGGAVHYGFDGDFSDSGAMKNNGAASGSAAVTANPANVAVGSGALLLDGGDASYVALSNALTFTSADAWTAAFWARRAEQTNDSGMVMGRRQTSNDFIWLNNTVTGFRFCSSTGATLDFTAPKDLNVHHYALSATGGGGMSLYIDGILTTNVSGANTSFMIDTIGQAYPTVSQHYAFKGVLDDVCVYPNTLDAASVFALYKLGPALALQYAFNGSFADSSAFGNNGTASGNAAITSDPSKVVLGSGALALDGADSSCVTLSNAITFATGVPWSAAFWACRGETGAEKGMVMGRNQTTADFIWLNDNSLGLRFRSSTSVSADFTAPKDLNTHHYALVALGNGTMSCYIDGVLTTNATVANTSFMIDTIGQAYTTNSLHYGFKGVLDDIRVYTYAVNAAAVSALFAQGRTELLHYAFDGNCTDSTSAGNNGTAYGSAAITTNSAKVAVGSGALLLDGSDTAYVAPSNIISFSTGSAWSTAFWACRGETGGNKGMVMGCRTNSNDFIWLNDSFTGLRFRSSTGATLDFTAAKDLNLHHYALVAAGNGTMSLYTDGILSANVAAANTSFTIDAIGQAYTASSHYGFQGVLDDVHVYAYALSATNVAALFHQGSIVAPPPPTVTRVHVFLQGGQSNSEGRADPAGLPTSPVNLQGHQADVDFYYLNVLTTLYPATTGGTTFGPEITCGRGLVDRMKPDVSNRVAIIKYSVGGTSLYSDWKAGGNATTVGDGPCYVSFQQMVANGLAALAAAYPSAAISLEGMTWMQGESDLSASAAYFANLTNFIADVRVTLNSPTLPFIIARLSASQTGAGSTTLLNAVRQAQTDVAAADPWAGLVDTDSFSLKTDHLHFDAAGQQSLGYAFAEQLLYLKGLNGLFTPDEQAAGATKPDADPDGDGMSNWNEYLVGTNPSDAASVLAITEAALGGGSHYVVRWPSVAGRVYAVERSTNLAAGAFAPVIENLPAVPPVNVYTDTPPVSAAIFYRIRADRP